MSEMKNRRPATPNNRQGGPMGSFGMPVEKAKNFKASLKRLLSYLKPHRVNLAIVLIFAILSTTFTILSPKVMSKAMNKLQDAYMAQMVIKQMSEGQYKAEKQMNDKMAEAQTKAVDQISDKMGDAQNEAVDKIVSNLGDAQATAVDSIYDNMASGFYNGMVTGQKAAVNQIVKQMATTQKTLITQMNAMMTQMQSNPQAAQSVDPKLIESVKKLLALPSISSQKTLAKKVDVTIKLIDILSTMPAIPGQKSSVDVKALKSAKSLLQLPLLSGLTNGTQKVNTVKKFIKLSGAKVPFDSKTMAQIYARIPSVKLSTSTSSSSSSSNMTKDEQDAVNDLLDLPLTKNISGEAAKKANTIKLIDIFARLPEMSDSSKTSSSSDVSMDKDSLKSIKKLLKLKKVDSIKNETEKNKQLIKLIKVFKELPDMGTDSNKSDSSNTIDKKSLNTVIDLLELPKLTSIKDTAEKTKASTNMLDVLSDMPDMKTNDSSSKSDTEEFDKDSIVALKEFINLPKLDKLTNADEKARVCRRVMDLGKEMQSTMSDVSTEKDTSVELTDDQITNVIKAIKETNGKYDFGYIGMIALILIAMYIISSLFSLIMGLVMSGVAQRVSRDLRREVDEKLNRLPLKYYDLHAHGDILSRVTNDVDTISNTLQQSLTQIITSVITIIGYIIMMLTISPILTLIVLATLPLYIVFTAFIAKKSQKYFAAQQKELGALSGHVEEMYSGHKLVKAFGKEKDSIQKFESINADLYKASTKAQFMSGIMFPLMNFVSNLGYVGVCVVGGLWITKGILGLGDIIAFIQYSRSFTMPIVQTANIANIIQSTIACAERVFEVLDEEEQIPDAENALYLENPKGNVKFEHVDFRYVEDVPLMEDMNIDVKPGHTVAIVGPTGAGKTTLINLLMRFYEVNAGKITVDDVDISDLRRSDLRKMFGMVLQDTWLFNGTVKENIAYGKDGATMEEIVAAAKAAHADHFIRTLPDGYDTVLNEEASNISQGEKQLLTIARAVLADPKILILDEATSSVDTRTEVMIQKAMSNLMEGRTSFVIAHRLSTIRDAEIILVMNKGSVIEMGNHKELMSQNGFYADLYNSQFAGQNSEDQAV